MPLLLANFADFRTVIAEGRFDPGIFKCVFMAGGPGAGKSTIAADIFGINKKIKSTFSSFGLKVVDSDRYFEYLLRQQGIDPANLHAIERDQPDLWHRLTVHDDSVRKRATTLNRAQQSLYIQGRLGMIVDGTADDVEKITSQKARVEAHGYDTIMIFVNTSLETAQARNRNPGRGRQLPDTLVAEIWKAAQRNLNTLMNLFGSHFILINGDVDRGSDAEAERDIQKIVNAFIRQPIQNPIGRQWLAELDAAAA